MVPPNLQSAPLGKWLPTRTSRSPPPALSTRGLVVVRVAAWKKVTERLVAKKSAPFEAISIVNSPGSEVGGERQDKYVDESTCALDACDCRYENRQEVEGEELNPDPKIVNRQFAPTGSLDGNTLKICGSW